MNDNVPLATPVTHAHWTMGQTDDHSRVHGSSLTTLCPHLDLSFHIPIQQKFNICSTSLLRGQFTTYYTTSLVAYPRVTCHQTAQLSLYCGQIAADCQATITVSSKWTQT